MRTIHQACKVLVAVVAVACATPSEPDRATSVAMPKAPPTAPQSQPAAAHNESEAGDKELTVALKGQDPVSVPGTDLSVQISDSWHKIRAPLVGVSILVSRSNGDKAQVGWRVQSGKIDPTWIDVSGRRYDEASSSYVEEEIPGWQARLISIDDESAGGSPTAITVGLRPAAKPVAELQFLFHNLSTFHGDGQALWIGPAGRCVVQIATRDRAGKTHSRRYEFSISGEPVFEELRRLAAADPAGYTIKTRPGIPDEVQVSIGWRDSNGRYHALAVWEGDFATQSQPVRDLASALRRVISLASAKTLVNEEVAPKSLDYWPEQFAVPAAGK